MRQKYENMAAIELLVRLLTCRRSFDLEEVRLLCKTAVSACFLIGIEPFQLPISDSFPGNLSGSQKQEFLKKFLALYMDSAERNRAASRIFAGEPAWSSLVHLIDEVIDMQITPPSLSRPQFSQTLQ
jgi:hypothetical protein